MEGFFDAGRVWADYAVSSAADGNKLGLKYGTGAGAFFQWDQAAVFRIDLAYSPESSGRGFPLSYYLENGFIF